MSMYWGYRCVTCNVDSDTDFNHGERQLSTLARHYSALKPILELSIVEVRAHGSDVLDRKSVV